jgi:glycosyltransferase involved in cell wall biosynthesis
MKILHVVNISFVIPYFFGNQLLYFKDKGYQEYIACSPSGELPVFAKKYGFTYTEIDVLRKISIWKDFKAVYKVARYIRKNNIEIVVGHTPKGAIVAMLASFITRVPNRIYFRHGLVYETATGFKRWLLMNVDRFAAFLATKVVCVSPSLYNKSLADKLNGAEKQYNLHRGSCNGIEISRFSRDNLDLDFVNRLRKKLGIHANDLVIGYTGRLVRDKGIVELVDAFDLLSHTYKHLKLLLVGMYEQRDALSDNTINKINSNKDIISVGTVKHYDIESYYALMDIFVLPSYREGFPTSVLEASSMGIPVVTTKATGCIDSIIDGKTGLFAEHTAENLAKKLGYFCADEERRKEYGTNGRNFVVDNFRQEIVWAQIEKLYNHKVKEVPNSGRES